MRNVTLSCAFLVGCVFCFAIASRGISAQEGGGFKPVSSVHSLMAGQDLMFKQIRAAVQNRSTPERGEVIEHFSEVLAELANVNTYQKSADDYRNWARTMRGLSLELSQEALNDSPDEAAMKRLVGEIKNTCAACHDKYQ